MFAIVKYDYYDRHGSKRPVAIVATTAAGQQAFPYQLMSVDNHGSYDKAAFGSSGRYGSAAATTVTTGTVSDNYCYRNLSLYT